ncbi:MAG: alpha-N-arabinofuranosidase [Ruminococcaceae bacterium]|nr:alpha-N-arabinofuranosidase [Oscillospiraceae bacterium]
MKKVYLVMPEKIGRIAPEVYGHFSEHIGGVFYDGVYVGKDSDVPNIRGFRKDVIEKLRDIEPPVLRWPGGCYAEVYRWRDGIGENRPTRPSWWTRDDGRYESNEVGTHEFMDFCELIGAKPYFAMNVTSITPMDARDWMDYCLSPKGSTTLALEREKNGHPEPFDIPYWGVGNENWGGGGHMTPDYYALEYRKFSTIMYNTVPRGQHVDLIAGGANGGDIRWTDALVKGLENCGAPVHGMSFHYYCGNAGDPLNFTEDEWYQLLDKSEIMEDLIVRHYAGAQAKRMDGKLKLVIDEWGCWHPDGSGPSKGYNLFEQQSTMRDAMVSAITLNIFNNHCEKIKMANVAQLCNNLHALFLAGGEHCITTPTYHVFKMYKEHQGADAVRCVTENNSDRRSAISVSASEKNGYVTVTLANRSCTDDAEISLESLGASVEANAKAMLLAEDDMHAHNTFEDPERVTIKEIDVDVSKPITIPKAGIMSISIKLA